MQVRARDMRLRVISVGSTLLGAAAALSAQASWQDVLRNLRHPDPQVRLRSTQQLGAAGYVAAAEPVAALILDPDDQVQAAAIEAELGFFLLGRPGGSRLLGFGGSRSPAQDAFEAGPLVRAAPAAPPVVVDRLIAAMRDGNARIRFDAVHALGAIAEAPLPAAQAAALAEELDHYDPIIRAATARVLARVRAAEGADRLLAALTDSNAVVRQFAIEALGVIRVGKAVKPLLEIVTQGRGDPPALSLLALARMGHAASRPDFRARLTDRDPAMRRAAAEGLGRIADRESLETLRAMQASDRSQAVRMAAAFAVDRLGESQTHLLAAHLILRDTGAQVLDYLFEIGRPSLGGIRATLDVAKDHRHRADLVHLIGFVGTRDDIGWVETFLADRDERVRRAAADAIARLKR
jgi:HEAT repeat protein